MHVVGVTEGTSGRRVKRRYDVDHIFWFEGNVNREARAKLPASDLEELE